MAESPTGCIGALLLGWLATLLAARVTLPSIDELPSLPASQLGRKPIHVLHKSCNEVARADRPRSVSACWQIGLRLSFMITSHVQDGIYSYNSRDGDDINEHRVALAVLSSRNLKELVEIKIYNWNKKGTNNDPCEKTFAGVLH